MTLEYLKFDTEDVLGYITLNRPDKKNALSLEMMAELFSLLTEIKGRRDIKVVIIRAAGKDFCAGHDVAQMINRDVTCYNNIFSTCCDFMQIITRLPQPVIAQVQGFAVAAGCQLVASCDLAVAEEGSRFMTPGVKIGLFCSTPAVALVRAVGRKRALEMLFTARMISAREAEQYGLVNKIVPADQLESETKNLARTIAEASLFTLGLGKEAFYNQINLPDSQAYEYAKKIMVNNLFAEDAQEGLRAFLEKRKPVWKDK